MICHTGQRAGIHLVHLIMPIVSLQWQMLIYNRHLNIYIP